MLQRYRNLAVKHKLRLIILFAVVAALIQASVAVIAYDQIAARLAMRATRLRKWPTPAPAAPSMAKFRTPSFRLRSVA